MSFETFGFLGSFELLKSFEFLESFMSQRSFECILKKIPYIYMCVCSPQEEWFVVVVKNRRDSTTDIYLPIYIFFQNALKWSLRHKGLEELKGLDELKGSKEPKGLGELKGLEEIQGTRRCRNSSVFIWIYNFINIHRYILYHHLVVWRMWRHACLVWLVSGMDP